MDFIAAVSVVVGFGVWIVAVAFLRCWALCLLWQWFAVPIFHVPSLSLAQAFGVSLVVGFLVHQRIPKKDGEKFEPMVYAVCEPLVALAVGYVLRGLV